MDGKLGPFYFAHYFVKLIFLEYFINLDIFTDMLIG